LFSFRRPNSACRCSIKFGWTIRVTYDKGEKISLKPGAEIDVVLEADSDATFKKHDVTEVTDKKFGSGG
jgi:hypothetical protein